MANKPMRQRAMEYMLGAFSSHQTLLIAALVILAGLYLRERALRSLPSDSTWRSNYDSSPTPACASPYSNATSRFHVEAAGVPGPIPWEWIHPCLRDRFTMGGTVELVQRWFPPNAADIGTHVTVWRDSRIDAYIANGRARNSTGVTGYGSNTTATFYQAFDRFPVAGKTVLVIGSKDPWAEALCLTYNASMVTTVDFNKPVATYPRMRQLSIDELDSTDERFDVIISYSSLEHDGLGRYGDPINPDGDLLRMSKIKGLIKPGGLFFLGVPVGNDTVVFNAHRVYGPLRLPKLIKGWNMLGVIGVSSLEQTYAEFQGGQFTQPIMVLT
eukprot:TRINITY_DN55688_c0_g1_i1.p1 TRINITY_DN55688_c0_g1~~TRINITY_DN55688_c0_g1_i1.p1  ORF type:complete len:340 (-),score=1.91 TRINITY_DN55688_c0_g1_i1:146-1129(-)